MSLGTLLLRLLPAALLVAFAVLPARAADAPDLAASRVLASDAEALDYAPPPKRRHLERDARRYVRRLDRTLGLSRRQEALLYDLLVSRAYRQLRHYGPRAFYPFPRQAAMRTRAGYAFWERADDALARVLSRRQRRAYVRYAHAYIPNHNAHRCHCQHHDDRYDRRHDRDRWDDDRWDDDRWDDDRRDRKRNRGNGRGRY